ncbi:MAG: HDOD domain-containing protein [Burkholderiaceae bacterium]
MIADNVDAQQLSELLLDDPMMCLQLLADVASLRPGESNIETVTGAILMMGVDPFLNRYCDQPTIEYALALEPAAMHAYRRLLRRALHSASLAGAFSVARQDTDIELVYMAALLGNVNSLVACVCEPSQAQALADGPDDSAQAATLMQSMGLPAHLTDLVAASPDKIDAQKHRIRLAHRFAWVLESGWSHPEMPALLDELAALLGLSLASARNAIDQAAR